MIRRAWKPGLLQGTTSVQRLWTRSAAGGKTAQHSLQDDYKLFHLDEFCSSEELRSAYEITVKRNSNDTQRVEEINRAYHRITVDRVARVHHEDLEQNEPQQRMRYHIPKIKSGASIDTMVNVRVGQKMATEDFSDLKGFGKPLPKKYDNPYIDNLQGKLNEIMQNTGVANEWIEMKKGIVADLRDAKYILSDHYSRYLRKKTPAHRKAFEKGSDDFVRKVRKLNMKIVEYNMLVPTMFLHMVPFNPQREFDRVVTDCQQRVGVDVGQTVQMPSGCTMTGQVSSKDDNQQIAETQRPREELTLLEKLSRYLRQLFQ